MFKRPFDDNTDVLLGGVGVTEISTFPLFTTFRDVYVPENHLAKPAEKKNDNPEPVAPQTLAP